MAESVDPDKNSLAFLSAPLIACIIAAAVLASLFVPGILGYPGSNWDGPIDEGPSIDAAEEANGILRERIELLNRVLESDVCVADGQLTTPHGPLPDELIKILPGPGPRVATPKMSAVSHMSSFSGSVSDLLKDTAVVVRASVGDGKVASGSGVFVAANLVVTNAHVVEGADRSNLMVFNDNIGIQKAELIVESPYLSAGEPDLAFLRVGTPPTQPFLAFASGEGGQEVIAGTFPAVYTNRNVAFRQWLSNPQSSPGSINPLLDRQVLNAIYTEEDGIDYIMHTALIGEGSSGGPLIDTCGRLLGINVGGLSREVDTSNPKGAQAPIFYRAIASSSVVSFASSEGISSLVTDATTCE